MNIDVGAKRERKRLKRLRTIAGRLTVFGQKGYPAQVLEQIRKAKLIRQVKGA